MRSILTFTEDFFLFRSEPNRKLNEKTNERQLIFNSTKSVKNLEIFLYFGRVGRVWTFLE